MDESDGDKLKRWIFGLIGVVWVSAVSLQAGAMGGFSGSFLRMTPDAISAGLGGVTLFNDASGYAYLHNPAAMLGATRRMYAGVVRLPLDRQLYGLNLVVPLPPTAFIGAGVLGASTGNITGRDSRGYYTGDLRDDDRLLTVSFANSFAPELAAGLTLNILQHQLGDTRHTWNLNGSGFGVGAGVLAKISGSLSVAVTIQNINTRYNWNTQKLLDEQGKTYGEDLPKFVAWGIRQKWGNFKLMFQHDYYPIQNKNPKLTESIYHGGMVYTGWRNLSLSGGAQYQDHTLLPGLSASYVLPLEFGPQMQIDLGIVMGIPGEGVRQYLSWGMEF